MRRPLIAVLIVIAALVLVVFALPLLFDANQFRPAIESKMTKSLGRQVKIGNLKLSILSGTVSADDLSIAGDPAFTQSDFLRAKALKLSVDLWQVLFSRKLNVDQITIDSPQAVLVQLPSGQWNFSNMGAARGTSSSDNLALSMEALNIKGARLSVTQGHNPPEVLEDVNITVKKFAPNTAFPFTLTAKLPGGGTLSMDGKAGPVNAADTSETPLTASLKITNLNLAASGFVAPSTGIDGIVSLEGNIDSNGQTLQAAAKVTADKMRFAAGGRPAGSPLQVDTAFTEDLKQHTGQLTRGDISIGGVKAGLTGTWTSVGESPVLKMALAAAGVPVPGLTGLLPAFDIVLPSKTTLEGGTASAQLAISGPVSALVIAGPVDVRNTRLKGFDLGAKLSPVEKLAGIRSDPNMEVQTLSANLRITPEGTSLQDIRVVLPSVGELTGAGTISPGHALSFRMRATVHQNAVISALGPANIPFSIGGTSADPQFRPDVGALATEEIDRGLNGVKVGGVDVGKTAGQALQGLFGGKKKNGR
ncbi:MAG TPA: AsmA family protein [Bryobacteraceae bacterium]|nr:AsmA family protein [Bryobacteraceae bacterium]